jgi:hypothetical protein
LEGKKKKNESIHRRKRKNKDQIKILENEFEKDANWSREKMAYLSMKIGLSEGQIYKWNWDHRKKSPSEKEDF